MFNQLNQITMVIKTKKNGEFEIKPSKGMELIVRTDLEKVIIKEVKENK